MRRVLAARNRTYFEDSSGELQTEFQLPKLQPGQIVAAVARPFNGIGGARLWSPMPGPGSGRTEELWTWDICTIATEWAVRCTYSSISIHI